MTVQSDTLHKLEILEILYRQGYQSDLVDRTVDKVISLERTRLRQELADLQGRLDAFEQTYHMASADFSRRFHAGELGDEADFFQWNAFHDMAQILHRRLQKLEGEVA